MCQIRRQHGDEICGAVSLVTSVPIEDALQALKSKLQDDDKDDVKSMSQNTKSMKNRWRELCTWQPEKEATIRSR